MNSGNRSFLLLLGFATGMTVALSVAACSLLSLLFYRVAADGTAVFGAQAWVIAPAAIFLALVALAGVLGIRSLAAQAAASRRLARRIERLKLGRSAKLGEAASAAGLRRRLRLIEADEPFSFTYGAWQPRIVVSTGLLNSSSPPELKAVLVHEHYHVRNMDPLKVVLARALVRSFFFVPLLRELEGRYTAGRELAADRRALGSCGRRPLASALLKAVRGPSWPELSTAAAIGGPELLGVRIAQLEAGGEPPPGRLPRRTLLLSAAGLAVLAASFVAALAGLGGLTAALELSEHESDPAAFGLVMAVGCAAPWLIGGWLAWSYLRA